MDMKGRNLDEIYDVIGIRVLVGDRKDCYGALGVVHAKWHPLPGEFDDYIATPKDSMYQSLHTAVIGPEGHVIEIQIRSREMHRIAEHGVAAHWRYKEGSKSDARADAKVAWLRQLMEWRDQVADAEEFVESMKSDVFKEQIYVFTPAGDVIELPAGATPVDFAYRIHTEVGHQCVGAKVNDQLVPLDYRLQNGQMVRILTSRTRTGPNRDWLLSSSEYITTASAREKIRRWFRSQERDENICAGSRDPRPRDASPERRGQARRTPQGVPAVSEDGRSSRCNRVWRSSGPTHRRSADATSTSRNRCFRHLTFMRRRLQPVSRSWALEIC